MSMDEWLLLFYYTFASIISLVNFNFYWALQLFLLFREKTDQFLNLLT